MKINLKKRGRNNNSKVWLIYLPAALLLIVTFVYLKSQYSSINESLELSSVLNLSSESRSASSTTTTTTTTTTSSSSSSEERTAGEITSTSGTSISSSDATSTSSSSSSSKKGKTRYWDSSKCTVIGLAAGYGLDVYKRFVGSLRATGFDGHIILGIKPNPPKDVKKYLKKHNVTMKEVEIVKNEGCTYYETTTADGGKSTDQKCSKEYPDYKIQWGRFPLSRDWLKECTDCTDGVMLTDTRDVYFQSNPFTYKPEMQADLMLFEEIFPNLTATHWLTNVPVPKCRNYHFNNNQPMICSGSTMGSRDGIIKYIDTMVKEFDHWSSTVQCRSDMIGDDQSIHDYLYYSGEFNRSINGQVDSNGNEMIVSPIKHRTGPIHVVGWEADKIFRREIDRIYELGIGMKGQSKEELGEEKYKKANAETYVNNNPYYVDNEDETKSNWKNWLHPKYNLIDSKTGYVTNYDGSASPQVHQIDRIGLNHPRFYLDRMVRIWNNEEEDTS